MSKPKSKQDLADWVLRRLGAPVVNVEITNEQLEDVIDEALEYYYLWHYDGTQRSYRSIKITSEMLTGNDRKHQNITADLYDPSLEYKIGSRVMLSNEIYVKVDSEERVRRFIYTQNPVGEYFTPSLTLVDLDPINDSDGGFILYDSDLHTSFVYSVDSNGQWVDSEGSYVLYDSDKHNSTVYTLSTLGNWVSDSDGTSFIPYDSDNTNDSELRYSRFDSSDIRYSRETVLNGYRFNRDSEEQNLSTLSFDQMWKREEKVLIEPKVDLDYSQAGQVGIPIPDNIYGVSKVFRINSMQSLGMWSYEYQMFLNNFDWFYGMGGGQPGALTQYYTTKLNIEFIDFMLNTQPAIRFNKHKNRLYIDTGWFNVNTSRDHYLLAEVYEITDPEIWGDVYGDKWLMRYATALAKVQWGSNLKKYSNVALPGGTMLDGKALYDEGVEEKEKLEEDIKSTTAAFIDSIIIG